MTNDRFPPLADIFLHRRASLESKPALSNVHTWLFAIAALLGRVLAALSLRCLSAIFAYRGVTLSGRDAMAQKTLGFGQFREGDRV